MSNRSNRSRVTPPDEIIQSKSSLTSFRVLLHRPPLFTDFDCQGNRLGFLRFFTSKLVQRVGEAETKREPNRNRASSVVTVSPA
jgi:hypothetical protein